MRDKIVHCLCNLLINRIASEKYSRNLKVVLILGTREYERMASDIINEDNNR